MTTYTTPTVDDVRALRETLQYLPPRGKYKVYVTKSEAPLAKVTLVASDIKHVGGTVNGRIDDWRRWLRNVDVAK